MTNNNKKIILHACCAPCASYPIQKLITDGFEPVVFFYNPNIFPYKEYEIRRNELKKYCIDNHIEYFEDNYEIKKFYEKIKGFEKEPEKGKRCEICFDLRLDKTAQFALKNNIKIFTTTLTVSPHKNSDIIFEIGQKIAKKYNLEFVQYNFKKQNGFKISRQIAKENNMYTQNYCGCQMSIRN
ncbi:MAG: epoxyqueuosine reductase QueH [Candidatus Gastranaerophilales bacterium]|nr:epoxyqueuosine reductase QueH [Candidatus Gastranaerophilales bacterium]